MRLLVVYRLSFYFIIMSGLIFAPSAFAQRACEAEVKGAALYDYVSPGDGVVIQKQRALMWMHCAVGQQWVSGRCDRQGESFTYKEALQYIAEFNQHGGAFGFTDWRLPSVEELLGIALPGCWSPALDTAVFPQAPVTGYWTSTADKDYAQGAMLVHFVNGLDYMGNRSVAWVMRLVRDHNNVGR